MRHQCAVFAGDGEVALVSLHRRGEHCIGQHEEGRVEVAGDRDRPFDERGVFFEELRVDERPPAERLRFAFHLLADDLHALLEPGHHAAFVAERRLVSPRVFECDAPPSGGNRGGSGARG